MLFPGGAVSFLPERMLDEMLSQHFKQLFHSSPCKISPVVAHDIMMMRFSESWAFIDYFIFHDYMPFRFRGAIIFRAPTAACHLSSLSACLRLFQPPFPSRASGMPCSVARAAAVGRSRAPKRRRSWPFMKPRLDTMTWAMLLQCHLYFDFAARAWLRDLLASRTGYPTC